MIILTNYLAFDNKFNFNINFKICFHRIVLNNVVEAYLNLSLEYLVEEKHRPFMKTKV